MIILHLLFRPLLFDYAGNSVYAAQAVQDAPKDERLWGVWCTGGTGTGWMTAYGVAWSGFHSVAVRKTQGMYNLYSKKFPDATYKPMPYTGGA